MKIQQEIEFSIVSHHVSKKSNEQLISEFIFVNTCLRINERDVFLSNIFPNKAINELSNDEIDGIKQSLMIVRGILFNEYNKRHLN